MRSFFSRLALSAAGVLIVICHSCTTTEQTVTEKVGEPTVIEAKQPVAEPVDVKPIEVKPPPEQQKPEEPPVVEKPVEQSDVVAEIGDYVITRGELEERLIREIRGDPEDREIPDEPVEAENVLRRMIAEKAMIIEGREKKYLEGDTTFKRFRDERLASLLLQRHLESNINVTESEIDEKVRNNPKLDRARAEAMLRASKQKGAVEQFYNQICEKRNLRKAKYNFPKAAQIHQRLLYRPQSPRKGYWITKRQMEDELTATEKNLALATYDGGKVTLMDWLGALHQISPPKRPRDLHTTEGVERLLDSAIRLPIFVTEAEARGLDKDEALLTQVREREDRILYSKVRRKLFEGLKKPTEEETADYFDKHKDEFRTLDKLKMEQIWCGDLKTAEKVKEELERGGGFGSVRQQHALNKKGGPVNTSLEKEGIFFKDLWTGEPGEIVGPVRGFYRTPGGRRGSRWQIKWRVVKVLEKDPGRRRGYTKVKRDVERRMRWQQREAAMAKRAEELLEQYSYKIYSGRIENINPLEVQ
ncbi:MAG: peptidylprolyl isomerase [Planctomycetota bacterium]|jgi:hypothetical protein